MSEDSLHPFEKLKEIDKRESRFREFTESDSRIYVDIRQIMYRNNSFYDARWMIERIQILEQAIMQFISDLSYEETQLSNSKLKALISALDEAPSIDSLDIQNKSCH